MEKSEITLHNTVLDNVLHYLYDQVKLMGGQTIRYSHPVEYSDGTINNNVTYVHTVQNVQPPQNNRLVVNYTFLIEPEGKPGQYWGLMQAIEFEGWQLQTNSVLIKAEFDPSYKPIVDAFLNDLQKTFEQVTQTEPSKATETQAQKKTRKATTGPIIRTQTRFELIQSIKAQHPDWTQEKTAMEANEKEHTDIYNGNTIKNIYKAMGVNWERADRVR